MWSSWPGGGAARAYYVGIETAGRAVPGAPRPMRALEELERQTNAYASRVIPADLVDVVVADLVAADQQLGR
jgi:hypothetical protein